MKLLKQRLPLLLLVAMVFCLLAGCAAAESTPFQNTEDFAQARIGILTGSSQELIAKEKFPHAQRVYFSRPADMVLAVEQGKIDCYLFGSPFLAATIWENAKVKRIEDAVTSGDIAFAFPKSKDSDPLRKEFNAFLKQAKNDGTLDRLEQKWLGRTEPTEHPDYRSLPGENGTIRLAAAADNKPLIYQYKNQCTGYEMELLTLFARQHGYRFDVDIVPFDSVIIGMETGKYDMSSASLQITPERAESVNFSDPYMQFDVVLVVRDEQAGQAAQESFFAKISSSFEKTFLREDRWMLIVNGIGVTMLISLCAAIAGSLLGFGLFLLTRSDRKPLRLPAKIVAKAYSRIVAGTPVVVILMILFYVIFGKLKDMSGIAVAIIGFALTFGSFVYGHMTVSVNSVGPGQAEAAYALGYTKNRAFFRVIFPQAMTIFLPSYCGQAVELIKATAVVGYIAVNDLTKMGDIIRSNTYEAFFPLIATALIYFLLTWVIALLLNSVKRKFDPKLRSTESVLKDLCVGQPKQE